MAKKRQDDPPAAGAPAWMSTFADMMTLVLCFFVLLFSMSEISSDKFQQLASSTSSDVLISLIQSGGGDLGIGYLIGQALIQLPDAGKGFKTESEEAEEGENPPIDASVSAAEAAELRSMASDFETYMEQANMESKIEVTVETHYLRLQIKEGVFFDSGKAKLKDEAYPILDMLADEFRKFPDNEIRVEGHTDDRPIGTVQFPSNWHLSAARAIEVVNYLLDNKGLDPMNVSPAGYGETRPIATNDTPEGRAQNRRVEIKILSSQSSGLVN